MGLANIIQVRPVEHVCKCAGVFPRYTANGLLSTDVADYCLELVAISDGGKLVSCIQLVNGEPIMIALGMIAIIMSLADCGSWLSPCFRGLMSIRNQNISH